MRFTFFFLCTDVRSRVPCFSYGYLLDDVQFASTPGAQYTPCSFSRSTPWLFSRSTPWLYSRPTPCSYSRPTPCSFSRSTPWLYSRPTPCSYSRPTPCSYSRPTPCSYSRHTPCSYSRSTPCSFSRSTPWLYSRPTPCSYSRSTPCLFSRPTPARSVVLPPACSVDQSPLHGVSSLSPDQIISPSARKVDYPPSANESQLLQLLLSESSPPVTTCNNSSLPPICTLTKECSPVIVSDSPVKADNTEWLPHLYLYNSDRSILQSSTAWLTDSIMYAAQLLLKRQGIKYMFYTLRILSERSCLTHYLRTLSLFSS